MTTDLLLRPLTPADLPALARFYAALSPEVVAFFEPFHPVTTAALSAHLQGAAYGQHVSLGVVDAAGEVRGHGFVLDVLSAAPVLGLGVHQGHHGQGWGRRLLAALLRETDARGVPQVTLTVVKANARAHTLYEQAGFTRTGETTHRAPKDSYCMARRRPLSPAT